MGRESLEADYDNKKSAKVEKINDEAKRWTRKMKLKATIKIRNFPMIYAELISFLEDR